MKPHADSKEYGLIWLLCVLLRHPPITSIAWEGRVENTAERSANLQKMQGNTLLVNCACGRRMVDPIWRPWWRHD